MRRRGGRRDRAIVAGGLVVLALFLVGCEALFGPGLGGFTGDFPSPSPIATYTTGTATIKITDGEIIQLDQVAAGSGVDSLFGSNVRWTGPSGWNLRVGGAGEAPEMFGASAYLTFDRIADGQHLSTLGDNRCIVDIDVADATAIRGTATCKGVEWYDALDASFTGSGPKELDLPKFDAEVTFEATPGG